MYDGHSDGGPEPVRSQSATGRPLGVKVLVVLAVLSFVGLFTIVARPATLLFMLSMGVVRLVIFSSLLTMRSWAWTLTVAVQGVALVFFAWVFLEGAFYGVVEVIGGFLVLTYLYTVRHRYRDDRA